MEKWYFTFGLGQVNKKKFVCIEGDCEGTRAEMFRRFGSEWCMQYSEADFKGQAERWGYTELKENENA